MNHTILGTALLLTLAACGPYQKKDLIGKWEAVKVLEEGQPLAVNTREITFVFYPNSSYTFTSTLNYMESGFFSIEGRLLHTLDTLHKDATEKAVEIDDVTRDSLKLNMQEGGRRRTLILVKKQKRG
jgi:hypothetical protein